MSQSVPLAPQAWPGDPKSYQNKATGVKIRTPGHQNGDRGCLNAARGLENAFQNVPFFQKVSQSVPLAPQAKTGAPKSYQNEARGCQNAGPRVIKMAT